MGKLRAMCCFSRPVDFVADTGIFARHARQGRQLLVYGMKVGASEALAMILPIPVAAGSAEGAVDFINLEGYPVFFDDLAAGFARRSFLAGAAKSVQPGDVRTLKVERVGSFVASFVPTVRDFARLDPRFRLSDGVWKRLGQYAKYGFAVFQLRKGAGRIHPMAFSFPAATPERLFFPTVHIHDGEVHPEAEFDHTLYCQVTKAGLGSLLHWEESGRPASGFVNAAKARGVVEPERHVFRRELRGMLANVDTVLRAA